MLSLTLTLTLILTLTLTQTLTLSLTLNTKKHHYLLRKNLHIGKQIRWAGGGGKEGLYSRETTEDILNGILKALIAEYKKTF